MAKKTYTREFKLKVVRTVESGELRPAQACREYQTPRASSTAGATRCACAARAPSLRSIRRLPPLTMRHGLPSLSVCAASSPWRTPR